MASPTASAVRMYFWVISKVVWPARCWIFSASSPRMAIHVSPVPRRSWNPQQWAPPAWPEPAAGAGNGEETAEERRGRLLHSFGNLTLLTQELNSSVSNGPFTSKRPEIAKQSVLRLNTYFQDAMTWDEAEIAKRGEKLLEQAKRIWPRPQPTP